MSTVPPTENFRRQHADLIRLGEEILEVLADPTWPSRAGDVRRLVARFSGKLHVHASMENEALYPRLRAHVEEAVRAKAEALFEEVAQIYASFDAFRDAWPSVEAIEADPQGFAKQTRRVLRTLWIRVQRENDELYPLVDASGD